MKVEVTHEVGDKVKLTCYCLTRSYKSLIPMEVQNVTVFSCKKGDYFIRYHCKSLRPQDKNACGYNYTQQEIDKHN